MRIINFIRKDWKTRDFSGKCNALAVIGVCGVFAYAFCNFGVLIVGEVLAWFC